MIAELYSTLTNCFQHLVNRRPLLLVQNDGIFMQSFCTCSSQKKRRVISMSDQKCLSNSTLLGIRCVQTSKFGRLPCVRYRLRILLRSFLNTTARHLPHQLFVDFVLRETSADWQLSRVPLNWGKPGKLTWTGIFGRWSVGCPDRTLQKTPLSMTWQIN